jgi:hypothetical protein
MPSQISHAVFGKSVSKKIHFSIFDDAWFNLGCQGPDLFLHNQRTKPSSLPWGRQMHRKGYGTYSALLIQSLISGEFGWQSPEGSYTAGFITHAVLDRTTHPFITYFSGWGPDCRFFHPFLERLLDTALSESYSLSRPGAVSFYEAVNLGRSIPHSLLNLHVTALQGFLKKSYPDNYINLRVSNAYDDTMHFLKKTDSWDAKVMSEIVSLENPHQTLYLLSLFHPPEIPAYLDVLNSAKREWKHPWKPEISSKASFIELFEKGVSIAANILDYVISLTSSLEKDSNFPFEEIALRIGNESLNTGLPYDPYSVPAASEPLDLKRFLEELRFSYAKSDYAEPDCADM